MDDSAVLSAAYTQAGPAPVAFSGLSADGSAAATTTRLTLTFDKAITGLAAEDITIGDPNDTGIFRGGLSGPGPAYDLRVGGITAGGGITVKVAKTGYTITPASKTVTVDYYAKGYLIRARHSLPFSASSPPTPKTPTRKCIPIINAMRERTHPADDQKGG